MIGIYQGIVPYGRNGSGGGGVPVGPAVPMQQSVGVSIVASALDPVFMTQGFAASVIASAGGGAATPLSLISSVGVTAWWRTDLGVTTSGGTVSQWVDQSPSGFLATQATGTMQPAYSATGGPNGTPLITADGVDDWLATNWNPPAPGTTPIWIWAVITENAHVNADCVWGGNSASTMILITLTAAGTARIANGANGPTASGLTLATPVRVKALYNNSTTSYLQFRGAAVATGVNTLNNDSPSFALFSRATGLNPWSGSYSEIVICAGEPSPSELAALDAYGTARYGAGIVA